jgi:hypothetical protein
MTTGLQTLVFDKSRPMSEGAPAGFDKIDDLLSFVSGLGIFKDAIGTNYLRFGEQ